MCMKCASLIFHLFVPIFIISIHFIDECHSKIEFLKICMEFIEQKRYKITHTHTQNEEMGKKSVLKLIAWIQLLYKLKREKFKRTQIFHLSHHCPRKRKEKSRKINEENSIQIFFFCSFPYLKKWTVSTFHSQFIFYCNMFFSCRSFSSNLTISNDYWNKK